MAKEKKKGTFWSDFKSFISKGNVVDMAVGVVIGGAFGKIVTGLVNYIINPVVSLITGSGKDLDSLKTVLVPEEVVKETVDGVVKEVVKQKEVAILWGTWLQTILDFLIVAFCIFLVLRLITKARAKLERKKIAAEAAKAAENAAKAEAEKKAAAEAAAAAAARQNQIEESLLNQERLLEKICEAVSKK